MVGAGVGWTGQEEADRWCREEEEMAEVSWDRRKFSARLEQSRVRDEAEAT